MEAPVAPARSTTTPSSVTVSATSIVTQMKSAVVTEDSGATSKVRENHDDVGDGAATFLNRGLLALLLGQRASTARSTSEFTERRATNI